MRITTHTDLLNYLADTFRLQSYLEIGVQNPKNNFDLIRCKHKSGVDPSIIPECILNPINDNFYFLARTTSDQYFTNAFTCLTADYKNSYDLIFIDGDHTAQQVKRDFENSLKCLTDNGFIVIHDTIPAKEEHTHVPRDSKVWNGDVYKFACEICNYTNTSYLTVDIDYGCTVIWKEKKSTLDFLIGINVNPVTTWQEFLQNKHLLNLVSVEQFKDSLHSHIRELRTA